MQQDSLTHSEAWLLILMAVMLSVISFLSGEEATLDDISRGDRLRIMCSTPGHNETLCHNKAIGREHD